MELREASVDELDIEGILGFTRDLASNSWNLWKEANHKGRLELQACLCPDGVTYRNGTIWNPTKCPVFSDLSAIQTPNATLVSPTGFEPVLPA